MATERIHGPAGGAEGFRAARRALQGLTGAAGEADRARQQGSKPAATSREGGETPPLPTGQILSITESEARSGVRAHKVAEARDRIAQGYYNRPEVRNELIQNLLRSFGEAA